MKTIILLVLIFAFLATASGQVSKINILTEREKSEGWRLLFNGKNLDGWKTFQGKHISGWHVVDGVLNNSGVGSDHGGDIVTREKFQNFELSLEWKLTPQSNSGIFYHVNEKIGEAIYESGPEYQLLDDKGWPDKLHADQYSGANYGMNAPTKSAVKEVGEWNLVRIEVDGTHVQHFLNGVKVVDYNLWDSEWKALKGKGKWKDYPYYGLAKKGNIGLQDHGGLAQFRNIKIKVIN
jgi:hypothetical protein